MTFRTLVVAFLLISTAVAQATWSEVQRREFITGPLAADAARGVVWHVGYAAGRMRTLAFDGVRWHELAGASAPARIGHALAFDDARQRLVLFGGRDPARTTTFDDTWEFDGTVWTQVATGGPSPRCLAAMAYDPLRRACVLVGGAGDPNGWGRARTDTWVWDGAAWTALAISPLWDGRIAAAIAYDDAERQLVLHGGHAVVWTGWQYLPWGFDETRTLDHSGTGWVLVARDTVVGGRSGMAMAWDPVQGRIVAMGGEDLGYGGPDPTSGQVVGSPQTFCWDGATWTAGPSLPEPRIVGGLAWHDPSCALVQYAGSWQVPGVEPTWLRAPGGAWTRIGPAGTPASLQGAAWDPLREVVIGVEGVDLDRARTWSWDGASWSLLADAVGAPPPRNARVAHHTGSGVTLLFEGGSGRAIYGEALWAFDGAAWTELQPPTSPGLRRSPAFAEHRGSGRMLLFGGEGPGLFGGAVRLGDTWVFDGRDWRELPIAGPSARSNAASAYDARRVVVVLFGGETAAGWAADTWEFDGSVWRARALASTPPPLFGHAMAWDGARERIVLTGRIDSSMTTTETWEYDGARWEQRGAGDPRASSVGIAPLALAWHGGQEQVVTMLGGVTWTYETPHKAVAAPFGDGCATSAGLMVATPRGRPWTGDTFGVEVGALPPSAPGFLVFGTSDLAFGSVALPWSLTPFGAPGCALHTDIALTAGFAAGTPTRTWTATIPSDPVLVTTDIFTQAVVLDPAANALGLALSNALVLRVGIR